MGESTCKLLPFKLGCAHVGSKGVASKGKLKGTTRKGIARAMEGAIWATWGVVKGVIKGVVKQVARDEEVTKGALRGAIEKGNYSREKEVWDGLPRCCDSRNDKGEMTWAARKCDPRWINPNDSDDEPSPFRGNEMELHIKHKGFAFDLFLLLNKYHNNAGFNFALDLVIDSKDLCFMVLLMCKHNTYTQAKHYKTWNQSTTNYISFKTLNAFRI